MNADSEHFSHWIGKQPNSTILPSQVDSTTHVLEYLGNGDLISVMLHAEGELSLRALDELKKRWEDEKLALDEMNRAQYSDDENASTDWG